MKTDCSKYYLYTITNKINGKVYVGSTKSPNARWRVHKSELNRGVHGNTHLQNAFNRYGDMLEFKVEKEVIRDVIEEEEKFILERNAYNKDFGYNICKPGTRREGKLSRETIDKQARSRWKRVSQYDLHGSFIATHESIMIAASNVGGIKQNITACLNGRQKTHMGYLWSYEGEEPILFFRKKHDRPTRLEYLLRQSKTELV